MINNLKSFNYLDSNQQFPYRYILNKYIFIMVRIWMFCN